MKTLKTLALGAAALASTGLTHAQTTIYLVASNGDRSPTQNAIGHLLGAGGNAWTYQGVGGSASGNTTTGSVGTPANSNYGAWNGTFQGQPVIIQTNFAGALTGISAIAGDTPQRFVASNGTGSGPLPDPTTSTNPAQYQVGTADLGLSTNFQSTSPFRGLYNGHLYNTIVEEKVGVSALVLVASPGFPADNITTQQAQTLYKNGYLSLAVFTGNPADENKFVFAIGRNQDAGQRYGTYGEFGLGTNTAVNVFQPVITGQLTTTDGNNYKYGGVASSHVLFPVAVTPGGIDSVSPGNGGYTTANDLAPTLTVTLGENAYKLYDADLGDFILPQAVAGYYIGYVTPNDYTTRIAGPTASDAVKPVLLKYNGVAYSTANIQNGLYTPWIYNRTLRRTGTGVAAFSGTPTEKSLKLAFYNALRDQIKNTDATNGGGIKLDAAFKVGRSTDGGSVFPTYY